MNLQFLSIFIDHFKSIRKMHFYADLAAGLHLIVGDNLLDNELGSNGAGKSSIFDAMCWCLYGRTTNGLKGPDLIPWETNRTVKVAILLQHDNERVTVSRTANPNRLLWEDNDLSQSDLEARIGMNFDLFCNTILLGQGRPLFFDLTPSDKMQLISDARDLDRWERRSSEAAIKVRELERAIDGKQAQVDHLERTMEHLNTLYLDTKKSATAWENGRQSNLNSIRKELKNTEKFLIKTSRIHDDADLAYDRAMTEINPLEEELTQVRRTLLEKQTELAQINAESNSATITMRNLKKQIESAKSGRCPFCGGKLVGDKHLKKLQQQLQDLTQQGQNEVTKGDALVQEVSALKKKLNVLDAALMNFRIEARKARDQLDHTTNSLAAQRATISRLTTQQSVYENENNPMREQMTLMRRNRDQCQQEKKIAAKELRILERKQKRTQFWVRAFKDVQLHLIEETLQEVQLASNVMLQQFGLIGWQLNYATEKLNKSGTIRRGIAVNILSPHNRKAVRWENWSGGEAQRLRLIGALALSEVLLSQAGVEPNLEILDEPTRGLSVEGVRDMINMLADRGQQLNRRCFLIDHMARQSSRFASTIRVKKTDRGSILIRQ